MGQAHQERRPKGRLKSLRPRQRTLGGHVVRSEKCHKPTKVLCSKLDGPLPSLRQTSEEPHPHAIPVGPRQSPAARLKGLGVLPQWAADHGLGTALYYADPDGNIVEINVNNYGNAWTATEHMKTAPATMVQVDPDKMIAARKAGVPAWELHERAIAREFTPARPYDPRTPL